MLAFKKILLPTDLSKTSEKVCKKIIGGLGGSAKAEILYVLDLQHIYAGYAETLAYYSDLEETLLKNAKEDLARFMKKVGAEKNARVTSQLRLGGAVEAICSEAKKGRFDLVVVGTHGRTGFRHLVLGSVAEKVVRQCPVPVLSFRQKVS